LALKARLEPASAHAREAGAGLVRDERRGVERLLVAAGEDEHRDLWRGALHPRDEARRVLDREVGPVVAVRQDQAAVVRVKIDPAVQRLGERLLLDARRREKNVPRDRGGWC
jgi:hypothetical protein